MAIQEKEIAAWGTGRDAVTVSVVYDDVALAVTGIKVVNPSSRAVDASITNGSDRDSLRASKLGSGAVRLTPVVDRYKMVKAPITNKITLASGVVIGSGPVGRR